MLSIISISFLQDKMHGYLLYGVGFVDRKCNYKDVNVKYSSETANKTFEKVFGSVLN
jgi:hypothetical protein